MIYNLIVLIIFLIATTTIFIINYELYGKKYFELYYIYYLFFIKKTYCNHFNLLNLGVSSQNSDLRYYYFNNKYLLVKMNNSELYLKIKNYEKNNDIDFTYGCPYLNMLNSLLSFKLKRKSAVEIKSYDVLLKNMENINKKDNRNKKLKNILK